MTVVPRRFKLADLQAAAARRDETYDRWREVVLGLKPGRVQECWDMDLLTVDEVLDAWRLREEAGLEP